MPTTTIVITVAPVASRPGCFAASWDGDELCISREPLLDAARELFQRGVSLDTTLVMRHAGAGHDALRGRLGALAKLTIVDAPNGRPQCKRWKPWDGSPPVRFPRQGLSDIGAARFERAVARGRP